MGKQERDAAVTTLVQSARAAYAAGNLALASIATYRDTAITQMMTVSENVISVAQINAINAALIGMGTGIQFTTTAVSDAYAAVVTANPALRLSDTDTL